MNLADFSLNLNRLIGELEISNPEDHAEILSKGRQLSRAAMETHLKRWFALNPDDLNTVPN